MTNANPSPPRESLYSNLVRNRPVHFGHLRLAELDSGLLATARPLLPVPAESVAPQLNPALADVVAGLVGTSAFEQLQGWAVSVLRDRRPVDPPRNAPYRISFQDPRYWGQPHLRHRITPITYTGSGLGPLLYHSYKWDAFLIILGGPDYCYFHHPLNESRIDWNCPDDPTFPFCRKILAEYFPEYDPGLTLYHLVERGARCDCQVALLDQN